MKTICLCVLILQSALLFAQEQYTLVDGQKFRIKTEGSGPVTVLFESGMSDSIEIWGDIPDSVALFARVFLYDRADIGHSGPSRQERTIPNMVGELHAILSIEGINPPYVLVGHSLGGFITRYFISLYPEEVAGLLLLDPAPEGYWNNMSKRELRTYLRGGDEWYQTRFPERYWKEWYQLVPNVDYMTGLTLPPDLPVILVSASAWGWFGLHEEILEGVKHPLHVELEGEHHIYKDYPGQIVEFIHQLVRDASAQ